MKQLNRKRYVLTIVFCFAVIASITAIGIYLKSHGRCEEMQCIQLPTLSKAIRKDITENTDTSYVALYSLPEYMIRVEKRSGLSAEDAQTLTKVTIMRMQGQFETARSPYPGILSDAITCDQKFDIHPEDITNKKQHMTFFTGYLNDRKQYGSCLDSEIAFTGLNAIFYCPNHKSWYRIEALIPKESNTNISDITHMVQSTSCQ